MSAMNNLDLQLKELQEQIDQFQETIQSIRESLSNNETKATISKMLVKKSVEGYTVQIKELFHKFGTKTLVDVNPKDYEDLYYSTKGLGQ